MKHHSVQREYWRSLEHLAGTPEARKAVADEFSGYDPTEMLSMSDVTRRRFIQLAGASMALAGLTLSGCRRWPQEKLAPYTSNPPNRVPGIPEQYATIMELGGVAAPLLVTSFDGRPIKIEGNPTHPYSRTNGGTLGSADALAQASILELYDPDRSRTILNGRYDRPGPSASSWIRFTDEMHAVLGDSLGKQGAKLAVLMPSYSGPSFARLKALVQARYPKMTWHEYEPLSRDNERGGTKLAMGKPARQVLHLDKASVVFLLDADPLGSHPAHVRYANDWVMRRRSADDGTMSRVYSAESAFTISGSVADARLPVRPSRMGPILAALAATFDIVPGAAPIDLTDDEKRFVAQAARDIAANHGSSLIVAGSHLSPEIQAQALSLNATIGAIGNTLTLVEEPDPDRPRHFDSIVDLANRLRGAAVDRLFILGGNPAYDTPANLQLGDLIRKVISPIHLGLYYNETSQKCAWHIPQAHFLEAWSDARAWDGTASVCQPLIQPLYNGKTPEQMLMMMLGETDTTSDEIVRTTFAGMIDGDFNLGFRKVLNDGLLPGTGFKEITAAPQPFAAAAATQPSVPPSGMEIRFQEDRRLYDGRFAGNGWLQELPDPMTKLVWDNAALISKEDADKQSITTGDMLVVTGAGGLEMRIAAYVLPGQPAGVIGLPLGYGRTAAGHIGTGIGFDTYTIRHSDSPFVVSGATIKTTGETYELALTQNQQLLDSLGYEGRQERVGEEHKSAPIIREATLEEYKNDSLIFKRNEDGSVTLQQLFDPPRKFNDTHKWGMAIDLSACIGCHACVVACQAENNVPIVGKEQVIKGRVMHWIRIDRYFKSEAGDPHPEANPEMVFQPVTCQQCENAPCEQVCPVGATMHDTEGLNVMVYNRCIGTRYCSNNCPYKVRRFNYLDWQSQDPMHDKYPRPYLGIPDEQQDATIDPIKRMVFNPNVTVRMRGVMEKCSFCSQRIHLTTQMKRAAGEELKDGDIVTACQQSCPTEAIVFGDLNDANSRVSKLHANNRGYDLLADLDTRPRNKFLAKISNPPAAT